MKRQKLWVRNWVTKRHDDRVHEKLLEKILVDDNILYSSSDSHHTFRNACHELQCIKKLPRAFQDLIGTRFTFYFFISYVTGSSGTKDCVISLQLLQQLFLLFLHWASNILPIIVSICILLMNNFKVQKIIQQVY